MRILFCLCVMVLAFMVTPADAGHRIRYRVRVVSPPRAVTVYAGPPVYVERRVIVRPRLLPRLYIGW